MRQHFNLLVLIALTFAYPGQAQSLDSLGQLKKYTFPVYFSVGHEQRAETIADRMDKAMRYHQELLSLTPDVILLVLSPGDWKKYTSEPVVYGMPHYNGSQKLVVAAENNALWKSFLPPADQLPKELQEPIRATYTGPDGKLTAQAFFDLLAVHELGHAFSLQGKLKMQRKWMGELFSNIFLHTYIAQNEPESLPALTLFPKMVISAGSKEYKYTSLKDVHERYNEIGSKYPKNYGWYQCRWHAAAADVYDKGGKQACLKIWNALKTQQETLSDEQLVTFLETADPGVANVMKSWDK